MNAPLITSIGLASCLALASAAEQGWVKIDAKHLDWPDSLPLLTQRHWVQVLDMPLMTHVRGFIRPSPKRRASGDPEIRTQVAELIEALPAQEKVDLKIEWLAGDPKPVDFKRTFHPVAGIARSSHRIGNTTITRTVLAAEEENAVFIHLIADQPGALSFRVTFGVSGEGDVKIEDRRQIVRPAAVDRPGSLGGHVWVLPFESDVATEGDSIAVRGEGEALILITWAAGSEATPSLTGTLARLGNRYDAGHVPPDPGKIWHGVLENHLKSTKNSP
ncbi:MAG: hypothetical protein V4819_02030 [Verrucomicrobiota bacterium]